MIVADVYKKTGKLKKVLFLPDPNLLITPFSVNNNWGRIIIINNATIRYIIMDIFPGFLNMSNI